MRYALMIGTALLLAGCNNPGWNTPPKVTYGYGAGNGDPIAYPGPAPIYSQAYGMTDSGASAGQAPKTQFGYGADGMNNVAVQMGTPGAAQQRVAAPANPQQGVTRPAS